MKKNPYKIKKKKKKIENLQKGLIWEDEQSISNLVPAIEMGRRPKYGKSMG